MARQGRRAGRGGLTALVVVVAVLLLVVDRVTQHLAENKVGEQLHSRLGTSTPPTVDITGFPFLTQLSRRSFSLVHVVSEDARPPNSTLPVKHMDLWLSDVTREGNLATSTAQRATGTVTMDYSTMRTLLKQSLDYAPPDRVQVSTPTTLMGVPVAAQVAGRPAVNVAEQTLILAEPELSVAGVQVPESTIQALLASTTKPVPLPDVPFGLKVNDVTATQDGLVAGLFGGPVSFP